jgi:hypothetical protein
MDKTGSFNWPTREALGDIFTHAGVSANAQIQAAAQADLHGVSFGPLPTGKAHFHA